MEVDLSTEYVGMNLSNPLIVAPAGISGTAKRMKRAEEAGAGAVVVKTLFQDVITRKSPAPRFKIIRAGNVAPESFVLYSYEQASPFDPERYAREISKAKSAVNIPVLASIGCVDEDGWVDYSQIVEGAGADAIEINVSCPHGRPILGQADVAKQMCQATRIVKDSVSVPVIPKMSPQVTSPTQLATQLQEAGADGVVMFNRFTGLDIDLASGRPIMHGGFAGHGGPWSIHYLLRWLTATSPKLGIPISASGGIWSGEDIVKGIMAGATTTQMCTAIVVDGYQAIARSLDELLKCMDKLGYRSTDEFRGITPDLVIGTDEIDRRRTVAAKIDPDACTSCGVCPQVCIYDAARAADGRYVITKACQGCGLCVELCPSNAIALFPLAQPK